MGCLGSKDLLYQCRINSLTFFLLESQAAPNHYSLSAVVQSCHHNIVVVYMKYFHGYLP